MTDACLFFQWIHPCSVDPVDEVSLKPLHEEIIVSTVTPKISRRYSKLFLGNALVEIYENIEA